MAQTLLDMYLICFVSCIEIKHQQNVWVNLIIDTATACFPICYSQNQRTSFSPHFLLIFWTACKTFGVKIAFYFYIIVILFWSYSLYFCKALKRLLNCFDSIGFLYFLYHSTLYMDIWIEGGIELVYMYKDHTCELTPWAQGFRIKPRNTLSI